MKIRAAITAAILGLGLVSITRSALAQNENEQGPGCALERAVGVTDAEALAVEEVVCGPLRTNSPSGRYRVRVVKIGTKVVVTLVTHGASSGADKEKQLVLTSIDEVTVAAPRLYEAAVEQKPIDETVDTTNVVGDEARKPKKKSSEVHFMLGVIGASAIGQGTAGGANMALSVGNERWSFVGDLRLASEAITKPSTLTRAAGAGGGGSSTLGTATAASNEERGFTYVSLGGGVRHHLSARDVAPFVGAGLGVDYVTQKTAEGDPNAKSGKTGLAAYAEIGLDVLRTHALGGAIVLRADAPTFVMEETQQDTRDPSRLQRTSTYTPILSAGIAMRF
jgi:hypothetical protein